MSDRVTTTYDLVPYPGHALAQAHPDRLATLATLFGMEPADVNRCRVLELGCGDGLNLTSVALSLPEAECLGIDLAPAGIQKGQQRVHELGLKNIDLRRLDLLDVGESFGTFDFIIAHGIYSWVPEIVRDKLLAICKQNLAENGVAYVSYNTYPGGHFRDLARGIMRFHASEFNDPRQRVTQARSLLRFIIESATEPDLYRMVLHKELERIKEFSDSSLFHDDLAEHNAPVYFYQFIEHAARYGLKYLSEAHFFEIQTGIYPDHIVETVNRMSDSIVSREQYLDFLKCRRFRQTLLCHQEQPLDGDPRPEKVASLYIASPLRVQRADSDPCATFSGPKNSSIQTDNPLIKAALSALGAAWPKAVHFQDLLATALHYSIQRPDEEIDSPEDAARKLGELLLRAYAGGIVELNVVPPRLVTCPSEMPVASPLARLQSRENGEIVNLRHFNIRVEDPLSRQLLHLLDGTRDRAALLDEVMELVESGMAGIERGDGEAMREPKEIRAYLTAEINRKLDELAEMALLVA
jgi:methyltransferase-like protein/2-polyprenyl-3-methyl-5-hydroxy-6-metoxy-1,4-benzoquinol methylase